MKVVEIRGYLLEAEMSRPIRNSVGVIGIRRALVVELVTDSGHSGWGETQEDPAGAWSVVESSLAREVLGVDPLGGEMDELASVPLSRVDALARSAVDIALWDLRGRLLGRSIADLAGGALRSRVPAYASGPFMSVGDDPYAGMLDDARRYVDDGYRALKLRCGTSPRDDLELVGRISVALGPEIAVMIDVNTGYSRDRAAELMLLSRGSGLGWIEEPIDPADLPGYLELSGLSEVPLAAGEGLWRPADFADFIASGAVGILQPDLYLCGGITGALRIARLAESRGIPLLPHVFGTSVNFAASLQLAAVLAPSPGSAGADYPWFEYDRSDNPLRGIGGEAALDTAGALSIPDAPGIGVDLSREMFEPFARQTPLVSLDAAGRS